MVLKPYEEVGEYFFPILLLLVAASTVVRTIEKLKRNKNKIKK